MSVISTFILFGHLYNKIAFDLIETANILLVGLTAYNIKRNILYYLAPWSTYGISWANK